VLKANAPCKTLHLAAKIVSGRAHFSLFYWFSSMLAEVVTANTSFLEGLGKVVIADILLAGDNAVVIALAVRSLPAQQQWWGRVGGSLAAVLLRVLFVFIIIELLKVPFLRFAGGAALLWISWKLLKQGAEDHGEVKEAGSLWQAVWMIMVADVVMSLDNVIAISAASHGDMRLVIIGLLLSIPLVIFGSGLLTSLMAKLPAIIWAGAGLLAYIGVEMILQDQRIASLLGAQATATAHHYAPLAAGIFFFLMGWRGHKPSAVQVA
jgi:YjbE family integral membrane protein